MTTKLPELNALASKIVGDGKQPDWFFVTDGGNVVTVTTDPKLAYGHWQALAQRRPAQECALENRTVGVLASVEPRDENDARLVITDNSRMLKALR